jgi:hypothetical protein
VALRQLHKLGALAVERDAHESDTAFLERQLARLALYLGAALFEPLHLDHNPALENRRKVVRKGVHVDYDPPANDPAFLIYRTKHDHHIKTNVRGDGAQYSDRVLAKRERRRTKGKRKSRPLKSASRWPPKGSRKMNWRKSQ